jgi:hypothetical protein
VAVARKLSVVMLALWKGGGDYGAKPGRPLQKAA